MFSPFNLNQTPYSTGRAGVGHGGAARLVFDCRTTSASTSPCPSIRMCCPTHCASYCAPCQPLLRAFSGLVRCPPSGVADEHRRGRHGTEHFTTKSFFLVSLGRAGIRRRVLQMKGTENCALQGYLAHKKLPPRTTLQ